MVATCEFASTHPLHEHVQIDFSSVVCEWGLASVAHIMCLLIGFAVSAGPALLQMPPPISPLMVFAPAKFGVAARATGSLLRWALGRLTWLWDAVATGL
jgi:hypothetical protein